jgi:GPH family glycoside/pentoside/hexuronide:cation symporter
MGMAISGAMVGWTLGLSGYVANASGQNPTAMHCIVALFTFIPGLIALLGVVVLRWYKLDDMPRPDSVMARHALPSDA